MSRICFTTLCLFQSGLEILKIRQQIARWLPWMGVILCLGYIFYGQAPTQVRAVESLPLVPNLELTLTDDPDPVTIGHTLTYTISLINNGTADATHVIVMSQLDSHVTFDSASAGGSFDAAGHTVTWNVGTLAPGETLSFTLTVLVSSKPEGQYLIANSTKVVSDEGAMGCDSITTTVLFPELRLKKSDDHDPVVVGDLLTYTIVISNIGFADATDVVVTDTLDPGVSFVSASDGGTHDGQPTDGTVTWPPVDIAVGEVITRTIVVTTTSDLVCGSTFPNTAGAFSFEGVGAADTITTTVGGGTITVNACEDQDADGSCGPGETLPSGVLACLTDSDETPVGACQAVPASFTVDPGTYLAHLEFTGDSQGYYPTSGPQAVEIAQCGSAEITLPALDPIHPKNMAVHEQLNKVYVTFQGPKIDGERPYPFVAVIDGDTDRILRTIPGGEAGIGQKPFGITVSGDNVYVASFEEGRITIIDANSDTVIANVTPADRTDFQPTVGAVNPINGQVEFADYKGGRIVVLDGTSIVAEPVIHITPASFSPFELIVADDGQAGYDFVTMRDALKPQRFKVAGYNESTGELNHTNINLPGDRTGTPHAIGLWQEPDMAEPRFFVTYADDPRVSPGVEYPNPNKLAVYSFFKDRPKDVFQQTAEVEVGDYAEAGLIYDPFSNQMLGTFAGFAYIDDDGDEAACNTTEQGGTYAVSFDGDRRPGFTPNIVVGNPPLVSTDLEWRSPFEIAINPNNNKVYVTDRCWKDYPGGTQAGVGAVLIYDPDPAVETTNQTSSLPAAGTRFAEGDVNGDGEINISDLSIIAHHLGTTDPAADVNGDGRVDDQDLIIARSNYTR